jgi:hypothetical protein
MGVISLKSGALLWTYDDLLGVYDLLWGLYHVISIFEKKNCEC